MPKRELINAIVRCKVCKALIVHDALIDQRLKPFLQTKSLCGACQNKEKSGTTANLDMRDRQAEQGFDLKAGRRTL